MDGKLIERVAYEHFRLVSKWLNAGAILATVLTDRYESHVHENKLLHMQIDIIRALIPYLQPQL